MLALRPNCECCDKDLQADSSEAMICSYECTFCQTCVQDILENVCPNCGGGFVNRPIRPKNARRDGVSLMFHPASTKRVNTKYSVQMLKAFVADIKNIKPQDR
ncbi:DUF1272 domain-containing protein [Psychromonas sp. KJ10-10]|uniref:DUF1272 domain-containing protein n=1 Tax=Psychromonas sp. KJ10-10 TaxID=3391823 RepID=UPI0039B3A793